MNRVMLVSSSVVHGTAYLDHCAEELSRFYREVGAGRVLFVPFAKADLDGYFDMARERFARMGLGLDSVHVALDAQSAVAEAQGFFVGGGNTFLLLRRLQDEGLIGPIGKRVREGVPYAGSSAGANLAGPTIRTTNDMPIVEPRSFGALGLLPFQVNPHYLPPDPTSTHKGETRDQRIAEFHEVDPTPVLAMREPAMLRVDGHRAKLLGQAGARVFRRGEPPADFEPGADLDFLVQR